MGLAQTIALSLDLVKTFVNSQKIKNFLDKKRSDYNDTNDAKNDIMFGLNKSIKNRTRDLILQFPILCSENISMENASVIAKAFEYENSNLIAMAINSLPASSEGNVQSFLKQFHRNIKNDYLTEDLRNIFNSNEKTIIRKSKELSKNDININHSSLNEASLLHLNSLKESNSNNESKKIKNKKNINLIDKDSPKINGNDIKAINDMNPTILKAQVYFVVSSEGKSRKFSTTSNDTNNTEVYVDTKGSHIINKEIMFGVKSIVHSLKSEEIIHYLSNTIKGNSKLFNIIRWSTGELKLFKDLIFASDMNKQLALDYSKKNSFWWKKLQDMANDTKIRGMAKAISSGKNLDKNACIPTATLVISKEDVDNIKLNYGFDILNTPKYAFTIQKNFFLLNFVIIDESTEIVYIFDENSKSFSPYSINQLKSKNSGSKPLDIKDLIPLLKR